MDGCLLFNPNRVDLEEIWHTDSPHIVWNSTYATFYPGIIYGSHGWIFNSQSKGMLFQ